MVMMHYFCEWFARHRIKLFWGIILVILAVTGFGLGRLSVRAFEHAPIIVEKCSP
jgi:hypothetical protein